LVGNCVECLLIFEQIQDDFDCLAVQDHAGDLAGVALRVALDEIFSRFLTELIDELVEVIS
jgi:hypothetical protein